MVYVFNPLRSFICAVALLFLLFSSAVFAESRPLTPEDQSRGTASDIELTRQIRGELMNEKGLSIYAQNVKIITLDGRTHLRGPVANATERARVAKIAKRVTGQPVENELEIKGDR